MYDDFLVRYCKDLGISEEEALTHAIVREFMNEKAKIDEEKSKNERYNANSGN